MTEVNDILNGIEMNDKRWPPLQMNIVNVESALKERYGGRVTFSDFRDVKELYDAVLVVCKDRGWDPPSEDKVTERYDHSNHVNAIFQEASDKHQGDPLAFLDTALDELWGQEPGALADGADDN